MSMPATLRNTPPLSLAKAAGILYLYWLLGHYITERPWLYLLLIPALIPGRTSVVLAACVLSTVCFLGTTLLFVVDPVKSVLAQAAICGSVPAVMLYAQVRGRLLTPFFNPDVRTPRRDRLANGLWITCLWLGFVTLLPLVSREYTFSSVLPLSIALFLGAYALPHKPFFRKEFIKRVSVNTVLVLGSIVLGVAVLEAGARIVFRKFAPDPTFYIYTPGAHYDLNPNVTKQLPYLSGEDAQTEAVTATVSAQRMRDRVFGPKANDEYRILMLGDSFTFGLGVEQNETIGGYLQTDFDSPDVSKKIVTMNMGVPGTGPWQHQIYLNQRGFQLEPDLVLHQVFLGNDLADMLNRDQRILKSFERRWQLEVYRLQLLGMYRFRAEQWLADHSMAYSAYRETIGRDKATRFLAIGCRLLPRLKGFRLPPTAIRPPAWEADLAEWYPDLAEAFELMMKSIQETSEQCAARGIGYVVYCIPQIEEVWEPLFEERLKKVPSNPVYERRKGLRLLHARLDAAEIPYVPLLDALLATPDPKKNYLEFDGHTSPEGNAAIARVLHDYLVREYFPAHPIAGME